MALRGANKITAAGPAAGARMGHSRPLAAMLVAFLVMFCAARLNAKDVAGKAYLSRQFQALKSAHEAARRIILHHIQTHGNYRLLPALRAYENGLLDVNKSGRVILFGSPVINPKLGKLYPVIDAFTGAAVLDSHGKPLLKANLPSDAMSVHTRDQGALDRVMTAVALTDPNISRRRIAIISLGNRHKLRFLPALRQQLQARPHGPLTRVIRESIARILLRHGTPAQKVHAAQTLGNVASSRGMSELRRTRRHAVKGHQTQLAAACAAALAQIHSYNHKVEILFNGFAGLSLASIYVLIALGLAIIFGLMGVINMAQGEFMAVGAFTTLTVCNFFKGHVPAAYFNWYFPCAIPLAFLVSALVGYAVEATIVRRLYGRPLETLLATWGVSLILIQAIRVIFGDNNSLTPPTWLSGGWRVMHGLTLPLNRLFIIGFCALCVFGMFFLVRFTRLGLLLRATTQDRAMAAALGVRTRLVDALTFALGAGLAGMAGCAVPLFAKIDPAMGQSYIVDSFMVVVVGGVGSLAGVVWAGLGFGFLDKYIEPFMQPVYAKVIILGLVIMFLQWRPSGLFAAKGRSIDN